MGWWSQRISQSLFFCLIWGASSQVALGRQDPVPSSRYTSARGAAMGDNFLPFGDDGAAGLFYNPAVIPRLRSPKLDLLNLQFNLNKNYLRYLRTLDGNFYRVFSLSGFYDTLVKNIANLMGGGGAWFPNFAMRGFAIGILTQSQLYGQAERDGTVTYRSLYQIIPAAGFGIRLAGGIVRLGYSIQWVNQASGVVNANPATDTLGYDQRLKQGSGFSHNVGFALTLPREYLPALNIVARNVGGLNFSGSSIVSIAKNSTGAPASEPMVFDAALGLQPRIAAGSFMNFTFQYRDFTNRTGLHILHRIGAGLEISLKDAFAIRAGWGSGYPSGGVGFKNKGTELSVTYYSEELGTSYQELQDSRLLFQVQLKAF